MWIHQVRPLEVPLAVTTSGLLVLRHLPHVWWLGFEVKAESY